VHEVHVRGLSINLVSFGQKFYRMTRINRCHSDFIEEANYCTLHCLAFCTLEVLCHIKERSVYVPGYDYSTFELYGLWCLKLLASLILLFVSYIHLSVV